MPLHDKTYGLANVRKAVLHFAAGKAAAGLLNLATTILAVRSMDTGDYAGYAVITGIILTIGIITSLGLGEVFQRFIPELLAVGRVRQANRMIAWLLCLRTLALLAAAAALYATSDLAASWFDTPGLSHALRFASPVLVATVLFNFLIFILETFLRQDIIKWLWVCVSGLRLALVFALASSGPLSLTGMLAVDGGVFGAGALASLWAAWRLLSGHRGMTDPGGRAMAPRLVPFIVWNYAVVLVLSMQGGAINKIVAGAALPVLAVAQFGFAQAMADTVQRYLPNQLLLNIVRPAIMARYAVSKDLTATGRTAELFFKAKRAPAAAGHDLGRPVRRRPVRSDHRRKISACSMGAGGTAGNGAAAMPLPDHRIADSRGRTHRPAPGGQRLPGPEPAAGLFPGRSPGSARHPPGHGPGRPVPRRPASVPAVMPGHPAQRPLARPDCASWPRH